MRTTVKTLATLLVASLLLAVPASAAGPRASAAAKCSVSGKERKLGASYVTMLSTRGVTCANAEGLVKRYHKCRYRHGGKKGRCGGLEGFRCTERRFNIIDTTYDSNVVCDKGAKRVRQTYTQLT